MAGAVFDHRAAEIRQEDLTLCLVSDLDIAQFEITTAVCYQKIEQLAADVELLKPVPTQGLNVGYLLPPL